jgi:hypothetical protein
VKEIMLCRVPIEPAYFYVIAEITILCLDVCFNLCNTIFILCVLAVTWSASGKVAKLLWWYR